MSACNPPDRRGAAGDGKNRVCRHPGEGKGWTGLALEQRAPPGPGKKAWDSVGEMESSNPPLRVGWGGVSDCVSVSRSGKDSTLARECGSSLISPDPLDEA